MQVFASSFESQWNIGFLLDFHLSVICDVVTSPVVNTRRTLFVKFKKYNMTRLLADLTNDPFSMDEPDPVKCKALESSLWELKVSFFSPLLC